MIVIPCNCDALFIKVNAVQVGSIFTKMVKEKAVSTTYVKDIILCLYPVSLKKIKMMTGKFLFGSGM